MCVIEIKAVAVAAAVLVAEYEIQITKLLFITYQFWFIVYIRDIEKQGFVP